jgi:hypothetical protein
MLVWNAMPSMTPMISPIRLEDWPMDSIRLNTAAMACPPSLAASAFSRAKVAACAA